MNQGKLDVVNQQAARVNFDILGISELKRTGMGEFNSGDHYHLNIIIILPNNVVKNPLEEME